MALRTSKVEYIAASDASQEVAWLQKLLAGLFGEVIETTVIHCDNQSCVKLLENLVFHDRLKHIEMRYHFIRDMVQRGAVRLQYIPIDEKITDVLTKPLSTSKFIYFMDTLSMAENASLIEREC